MNTSTVLKRLSMAAAGVGIITLGVVTTSTAQAASIVVPNSLETMEGNADNGFPFNIGLFGVESQRYQQVFAASEFASLSGAEFINRILFRPDAFGSSSFSSTIRDIQINLSTTSAAPDALSPIFANNVGSNDTVVFSGPLSLSSADSGPPAGPKNFDIAINLSNPFLYNPSVGNLLLDVRNFSGGSTTQFDAEATVGDSISRVFNSNVNDPIGTTDTLGLVAKFETTPSVTNSEPVPEPLTILGSGLALGFGSLMKRQQSRKLKKTSVAE